MKYTAYTYLIKCNPTGQLYYGVRYAKNRETMVPEDDLWRHYFTSSNRVYFLLEKYGKDAFTVKVDRVFDNAKDAIEYEVEYLLENLTEQYLNGNINGAVLPKQEYYDKISAYHKGKPKSEEHKRKISESNKGISSTWNSRPEYRAKMSKLKSGEGNGMFNKKHTDETRQKIGEANRGNAAWNKGKTMWTEEQRDAISKRNKGSKRPQSAIDAAAEKNRGKKRPTLTCPHCDKTVAVNTYARWHGDRCENQ